MISTASAQQEGAATCIFRRMRKIVSTHIIVALSRLCDHNRRRSGRSYANVRSFLHEGRVNAIYHDPCRPHPWKGHVYTEGTAIGCTSERNSHSWDRLGRIRLTHSHLIPVPPPTINFEGVCHPD